jgi:hypothetical protein
MDTTEYVERLYGAFSDAPRPAKEEITPHRCYECDEVTARLAPHQSREVPDDDMFWLGDSMPLLGHKAFRYFLPRFIEFCLRHPNSSANGVIDYNPGPFEDLHADVTAKLHGLNAAERRALLEFVQLRLDSPECYDSQYLENAKDFLTHDA